MEHPALVRLLDDACDLHPPALEVHHDEHGVSHRSAKGQHLYVEEVHRRDRAPERLQKRRPRQMLAPLRRRHDAVVIKDSLDG